MTLNTRIDGSETLTSMTLSFADAELSDCFSLSEDWLTIEYCEGDALDALMEFVWNPKSGHLTLTDSVQETVVPV